jgi:hypothetical protein
LYRICHVFYIVIDPPEYTRGNFYSFRVLKTPVFHHYKEHLGPFSCLVHRGFRGPNNEKTGAFTKSDL